MKKIYQLLSIGVLLFGFNPNLNAQCSTASVVPYTEDFSSLTANNQLPACWQSSNPGTTCLTFITPTKHAAFFDSPTGVNHFYTNGIQLNAGVTYSAEVWRKVTNINQLNWTDLSLLVGPNQGPAGLVSIASSNGPVVNANFTLLSGTFTVNNSGVYYVAVRGTSNASSSNYLHWDDLSITIPCGPGSGNNTPTLSIAGSNTLCTGDAFSTYTVAGANTYSWNAGPNTNTLIPSPTVPGSNLLTVNGMNTLSGCVASASLLVMVLPSPSVLASATPVTVCPGQISTLTSFGSGATTHSWSSGGTNASTTVSPTQASSYTVTITSANGCKAADVVSVQVFPVTTITASASHTFACAHDGVTLYAAGAGTGATTYTWVAPGGSTFFFTPFIPDLLYNGTYTITGKDANGCLATTNLVMNIDACTGIEETRSAASQFYIYPNPGSGKFYLETGELKNPGFELYDLSGRVVSAIVDETQTGKIQFNIQAAAPGIYFLKIQDSNKVQILKFIKE